MTFPAFEARQGSTEPGPSTECMRSLAAQVRLDARMVSAEWGHECGAWHEVGKIGTPDHELRSRCPKCRGVLVVFLWPRPTWGMELEGSTQYCEGVPNG